MMKTFRRAIVAFVVVAGTTVVDARVINADTVNDVDEVTTGYVRAWVPPIPTAAEFELTVGDETFTHDDLNAAMGGTLTLSFWNHTVGSPPEVAHLLCPGAASGKRAGVRLRVTGLSAGTEVWATFSAESATGVSHVVKLGSSSLEVTGGGVQTGVCKKL